MQNGNEITPERLQKNDIAKKKLVAGFPQGLLAGNSVGKVNKHEHAP